jgi:hypothetical protein
MVDSGEKAFILKRIGTGSLVPVNISAYSEDPNLSLLTLTGGWTITEFDTND